MSPIPLGILASAGGVAPIDAYEQIATSLITNWTTNTITFSSIPQTYRHLQIRATYRSQVGSSTSSGFLRFNGDTASNYSQHSLYYSGAGSPGSYGGSANSVMNFFMPANSVNNNAFAAAVIDIQDYSLTSKNKTLRALVGWQVGSAGYENISLESGSWRNTAAITSLTLQTNGGNFGNYCRFSLYGIKGA